MIITLSKGVLLLLEVVQLPMMLLCTSHVFPGGRCSPRGEKIYCQIPLGRKYFSSCFFTRINLLFCNKNKYEICFFMLAYKDTKYTHCKWWCDRKNISLTWNLAVKRTPIHMTLFTEDSLPSEVTLRGRNNYYRI